MVAFGALVIGTFGVLYRRFLRYDHVALRHVPEEAVFAVRVDITQAALYDPVRRYALPLLGGLSAPADTADERLRAFERASGLHRGDLREIVAAVGAGEGKWALVFNGLFSADPGSRALGGALSSEPGWKFEDGSGVSVHASGVCAARSADGAAVLASNRAWLDGAMQPTDRGVVLGVSSEGFGGFALSHEALVRLSTVPAVLASGDLPLLFQKLDRVRGELDVGERVGLRVRFDASTPALARRAAEGTYALLDVISRQDPSPLAPLLRAGLDRGRLEAVAAGDPVLPLVWERIELDRGLALLADRARR